MTPHRLHGFGLGSFQVPSQPQRPRVHGRGSSILLEIKKTVALSTAEADLYGATEALAVITFLCEIKDGPTLPFFLRIANTCTSNTLLSNHMVKKGTIKLDYVASADNLEDMFTKPYTRVPLEKFVAQLMHPVPEEL